VKDIFALTGYIRGGCTPIGMKKAFPTVIHDSVMGFDTVIISGGRIGAQIVIAPADLVKVTRAKVADIIHH
jgi:Cys-tRNA(Pro)/Cys-tRNA(Cys) deacylase